MFQVLQRVDQSFDDLHFIGILRITEATAYTVLVGHVGRHREDTQPVFLSDTQRLVILKRLRESEQHGVSNGIGQTRRLRNGYRSMNGLVCASHSRAGNVGILGVG